MRGSEVGWYVQVTGKSGSNARASGAVEFGAEDKNRASALEGEDLGEVSREIQVPVHEIEEWRRVFIETGTSGLKRRSGDDPAERELRRTQAKLGETKMELDLVKQLLEKGGTGKSYGS